MIVLVIALSIMFCASFCWGLFEHDRYGWTLAVANHLERKIDTLKDEVKRLKRAKRR